MLAGPDGGVVDALAGILAGSCEDGNGYKAAAEADVENDAKEGEEGDAAKEARKNHSEGGIDDGSSGHALNCLLPSWDCRVASASCDDC